MMNNAERGFSIIELLIVCVVIGIIAVVAVPHLQRAILASENANMYGTLKAIATTQASFVSQNNRFARLGEVNNLMSGMVGNPSGAELVRGKFVLSMSPSNPTDAELRTTYHITATRNIAGEGAITTYVLTQSGMTPIFP